MDFLADVAAWFARPEHWRGVAGVPNRLYEHIQMSAFAIVCAAVVALPAGALLGHVRRGGLLATSVVNIGRAIPSFAIVALALPISLRLGLGLGFWPTWLAMFLLALPPLFTNTYTAVTGVDPETVSAARGMGLRERDILLSVEIPLGAPLILAALRVATLHVIATVPLGALVGWGGLGRLIIDGLAVRDYPQAFAGALLVAALAVSMEGIYSVVERFVLPRGVQRIAEASTFVARPI
jgi:osmoprotectant transport system permease protein